MKKMAQSYKDRDKIILYFWRAHDLIQTFMYKGYGR